MSKGSCPFCGVEGKSTLSYPLYECGTWWCEKDHSWIRKGPCYETELATLKKLINRCIAIGMRFVKREDYWECLDDLQEILDRPEVKAIRNEKP
jgi:hypothetical protein